MRPAESKVFQVARRNAFFFFQYFFPSAPSPRAIHPEPPAQKMDHPFPGPHLFFIKNGANPAPGIAPGGPSLPARQKPTFESKPLPGGPFPFFAQCRPAGQGYYVTGKAAFPRPFLTQKGAPWCPAQIENWPQPVLKRTSVLPPFGRMEELGAAFPAPTKRGHPPGAIILDLAGRWSEQDPKPRAPTWPHLRPTVGGIESPHHGTG